MTNAIGGIAAYLSASTDGPHTTLDLLTRLLGSTLPSTLTMVARMALAVVAVLALLTGELPQRGAVGDSSSSEPSGPKPCSSRGKVQRKTYSPVLVDPAGSATAQELR